MASSLRTHSLCFCHSLSLSSQKHPAFISCKAHGTHSLVPSLSTILFRRHNRKYPFAFSFSTITAFNECGRDYRFPTLVAFSSSGEVTETEELEGAQTLETTEDEAPVEAETVKPDSIDGEELPVSAVKASLESYREALANNDESTLVEIEKFLQSIEVEKNSLSNKVAALSEELSSERDRVLRISADFDNFRKRTERERLSLVSNAQGEVIENLLPILDNFERAKAQIKVETEGEEKINNSYQSIYKQFVEIMVSLGVVGVDTVGNPFDPLLHEAIMREDSTEFEESIILQEFRKGFKLGDRLLRPSMVKVSAGPGPAKPTDEVDSSASKEPAEEVDSSASKEETEEEPASE
ncbi:uncharacterized protein LOC18425237 isoform X2 [Amborella trichopoda]|uniref:uncharacterized protein LOC18425237 isoform X2 n=1 Tax=Amborella trichopoda TaxID=13333 RepID=UPI0005D439C1|nr:uncharacterized protein LOC18425237 isoform X2 [Amborella trichopoda]|eukprot:XP_011629291.1 uncharacterized protein LOC18425237 isoform X2 [Amborella trichopoda]